MAIPNEPITRAEQYLAKIAGQDVTLQAEPVTRTEQYLDYIAKNGGGGGGPELPDVTTDDNGKVLGVVNGAWNTMEAPELDATGASAGQAPIADGMGGWDWGNLSLDASRAESHAVPTANGSGGWTWAQPLVIRDMTKMLLMPINHALFGAFRSFLQAAVAATGTVVRATQAVSAAGFLADLYGLCQTSPVALYFSAGEGSDMLLPVVSITPGAAGLRVAGTYPIDGVGVYDLAGDVIINGSNLIIMGYALAEATT